MNIETAEDYLLFKTIAGSKAYGFEIKKNFYQDACSLIKEYYHPTLFVNIDKIKGKYVEQNIF
jgi:hypothetical protein